MDLKSYFIEKIENYSKLWFVWVNINYICLSMIRAHCTGQGGLNSYLWFVNNWSSLRLDLFVIRIKQWCLGNI